MMDDLLSLVERHTQLNRVASTKGGEYAGCPGRKVCPLCNAWRYPESMYQLKVCLL